MQISIFVSIILIHNPFLAIRILTSHQTRVSNTCTLSNDCIINIMEKEKNVSNNLVE